MLGQHVFSLLVGFESAVSGYPSFSSSTDKATTMTNSCANFEPETSCSEWSSDFMEIMTLRWLGYG